MTLAVLILVHLKNLAIELTSARLPEGFNYASGRCRMSDQRLKNCVELPGRFHRLNPFSAPKDCLQTTSSPAASSPTARITPLGSRGGGPLVRHICEVDNLSRLRPLRPPHPSTALMVQLGASPVLQRLDIGISLILDIAPGTPVAAIVSIEHSKNTPAMDCEGRSPFQLRLRDSTW